MRSGANPIACFSTDGDLYELFRGCRNWPARAGIMLKRGSISGHNPDVRRADSPSDEICQVIASPSRSGREQIEDRGAKARDKAWCSASNEPGYARTLTEEDCSIAAQHYLWRSRERVSSRRASRFGRPGSNLHRQ